MLLLGGIKSLVASDKSQYDSIQFKGEFNEIV